ncbi:phosphohydrolase [Janibacter hoylei PVAS-1]|uniref:Metallophosphoesterase n=1 Tax=Janibacter hoylei PVAS-1 TaxID=1210046 RepID=K1E333_9MICO|nr:metallophosphoesterase [Janibacter hoylei]EKA61426.1 phosphohydrolase [Janibacter hoylei PVAS-1]RWU81269.1 metallophosphoesterase [Janibacter hoylei PVAS-1]
MTLPPSTRLVAGAAAAGAAALAWGALVEPRLFTLRRYALPVLRPGSLPVRVLQLSDIHMVPGQRTKADWIRGLAALEPDLVVNTGDNLSHLQAVPHALEALKPLLERPGVFVMGSNDYYAPTPKNPGRYLTKDYAKVVAERVALPTEELRSGMTDAGWVDLDNARTSLHLGGQRIDLVGVDDPHIERDDYASVSAPAAADATTVGVAHAPYQRVLDAMTADGARLVIAGHTHGGQLCVPGYGALVTNCDLDRGRAKGVSRWWPGAGTSAPRPSDAAWLHVSAGLGASRYAPVRFSCRPEATLMTLVPEGLDR